MKNKLNLLPIVLFVTLIGLQTESQAYARENDADYMGDEYDMDNGVSERSGCHTCNKKKPSCFTCNKPKASTCNSCHRN